MNDTLATSLGKLGVDGFWENAANELKNRIATRTFFLNNMCAPHWKKCAAPPAITGFSHQYGTAIAEVPYFSDGQVEQRVVSENERVEL